MVNSEQYLKCKLKTKVIEGTLHTVALYTYNVNCERGLSAWS